MSKPDLNKLKAEIDVRKREKSNVANQLGESSGITIPPKDTFLNDLLLSLNTGRESNSTNLIKIVENKTAIKQGEQALHKINENSLHQAPLKEMPQKKQGREPFSVDSDRENELWEEMERKRKLTLVDSIEQFGGVKSNQGIPRQNMVNEGALSGNVKGIVDNYLTENFGPVLEEAIRSTMLEMYAVERIKEVLNQNKELIKSIVYETIREIQQKNKTKA